MSRPKAVAVKLIDDERLRVTRFEFEPGAETGWHRHEYDYVVTAVEHCSMLLEEPGGQSRTVDIPKGTAYQRERGVEHNVINRGDVPMSFVELELKQGTVMPQ